MFRAKRYVSFPGRTYLPGELIDAELTDAQKERLTRLGAIEQSDDTGRDETYDEPAEAETEETDTEEAEDEEGNIPAPITIDVMDGITPKPKRKRKAADA